MAKVTVKMNPSGARELMNSPEVQDLLLDAANRIRDAAGRGYEADVQAGRNRAHAMVKSTDYRSMFVQARDNRLLKSIDAAR